ncbi:ABC transporter permease [Oscillospiraceae bacterium PP1C4]
MSTNKAGVTERKSYTSSGVAKYFKENLGILIAFVLICIIVSCLSPVFLTADNAFSVLRQVSTNANLALGMTLVIILGGIDLSVGAVVALSGTITVGLIVNNHMNIWAAVCIGLTLGTLCGLINGVIIAYTRMAPFIVTMAVMNIARGAAYIYSNGLPIRTFDDQFAAIGTGYLGPIPLPVIYMLVSIVVISVLLSKTRFGSHVYALGGNREAAIFSGVPVKKVEIIVYTLSGFLSAVAGVVLAARMYSAQPSVSQGAEMDAIAACVLGGVSMSGGLGKIGGVFIGVLIVGIISNGLNLLNVNSFWQLIVKGAIVLLAVYVDIIKKQKMLKKF